MKLLHVITSMDPLTGGPCQGIRNSNQALSDFGVHREVVSLDSPSASFLGQDLFPIHAIGPVNGTWKYSRQLIPWLLDNFARFDVVVVNGLWQYHAFAVQRALKLYKSKTKPGKRVPKLFIMPHGMLDPYFQLAKSRRLKAIRNWFYWHLIEKRVIREADGVLFTCLEELQLARLTFKGYKPRRELNVGYGIESPPAFFDLMKSEFLKKIPSLRNKRYFLFLSRIHEKKGVDLLIKAYTGFIKLNPELSLPKLVIAGPGLDTEYGRSMKLLASDSTASGADIFFPGMLSGDSKWGAMYGCEAFVLPSHQENFGIAVAEALACSKPVLISNQVNIWREIKDTGGGIVAEDTLEGTEMLLQSWMCLDAIERKEMSVKARKSYQEHFNVKPAAHKFFEAISVHNTVIVENYN
ncbi:glycosyltransferase [Flavihumibacter sp. R14]|nr:glycosyltransferase [Flavihumibacter soli]